MYFVRLIRNMCFPQTGKLSWKTSSQKGLGWEEPQGTLWGGGGGAAGWGAGHRLWEENMHGKQLSCGRFPGEIPFQELKILNNNKNFKKSKRLWTFLSGNSAALRETRWLAMTIPDPRKTQHPHTHLVFSELTCSLVESIYFLIEMNWLMCGVRRHFQINVCASKQSIQRPAVSCQIDHQALVS